MRSLKRMAGSSKGRLEQDDDNELGRGGKCCFPDRAAGRGPVRPEPLPMNLQLSAPPVVATDADGASTARKWAPRD
jgi:hypothetical protein